MTRSVRQEAALKKNKGFSLIVLVIIIVILGILGAGLVSLMGSKHRSYPMPAQNYKALNLANAGVEFAIRYAREKTNPAGTSCIPSITQCNCDFLSMPWCYIPIAYRGTGSVPPDPSDANLSDVSKWKRIDVNATDRFYISYYLNDLNSTDPYNNTLFSVGVSGNAKRMVTLKKFLSYASPPQPGGGSPGLITLIPTTVNPTTGEVIQNLPEQESGGDNEYTYIPLLNSSGSFQYIYRIDIWTNNTGDNCMEDIELNSIILYKASNDLINTRCKSGNPPSTEVPQAPPAVQLKFNYSPPGYTNPCGSNVCFAMDPGIFKANELKFKSSAKTGIYYVTYHFADNPALINPMTSSVQFYIKK